jgi:hypothetical protein
MVPTCRRFFRPIRLVSAVVRQNPIGSAHDGEHIGTSSSAVAQYAA